jgi:hypothetical protein
MTGNRFSQNRKQETLKLLLLLCFLLPAFSTPADARPLTYAFEVGGGAFVPFESDHRSAYGTGTEFSFGVSPLLSQTGTWLILEAGLVKASGHEYRSDPTFETPEDKYWLLPVRLGARRDLLAETSQIPMKFCLGAGFQTTFTGWEDGYGSSYKTPTFGFFFEIRPELTLNEAWGLWLSSRMTFLGNVEYEESGIPDINYSANSFQLGLSYTRNR